MSEVLSRPSDKVPFAPSQPTPLRKSWRIPKPSTPEYSNITTCPISLRKRRLPDQDPRPVVKIKMETPEEEKRELEGVEEDTETLVDAVVGEPETLNVEEHKTVGQKHEEYKRSTAGRLLARCRPNSPPSDVDNIEFQLTSRKFWEQLKPLSTPAKRRPPPVQKEPDFGKNDWVYRIVTDFSKNDWVYSIGL